MNKDPEKRGRLIELGAPRLADILLELTDYHEDVENLVDRLTATPEENTKQFKMKLAGIKRRRRVLRGRQSFGFVNELRSLLQDLQAGDNTPKQGVELIASFYKSDHAIFKQCDDSYGNVGDVFRIDARNLFIAYASQCDDKDWLVDLVVKLNQDDGYGIRDTLFTYASEYLPESAMYKMVAQLWELSEKEPDEYQSSHWIHGIVSLAQQLQDAPLFEKAQRAIFSELPDAVCLDIARVYLETGDAATAQEWLDQISAGEHFHAYERDKLSLSIYSTLNDFEKMKEISWQIFRRHRSEDTLVALLDVIGQDQREQIIEEELRLISQDEFISYTNLRFLIEIDCLHEAERYTLNRRDQFDGDLYIHILPLAEHFETKEHFLAASVLYRSLLESILKRANSKYYNHGVRYLKKLDLLATKFTDWQDVEPHTDYFFDLQQDHGRKKSFWSRYGK